MSSQIGEKCMDHKSVNYISLLIWNMSVFLTFVWIWFNDRNPTFRLCKARTYQYPPQKVHKCQGGGGRGSQSMRLNWNSWCVLKWVGSKPNHFPWWRYEYFLDQPNSPVWSFKKPRACGECLVEFNVLNWNFLVCKK